MRKINNASPRFFEYTGDGYARDTLNVYYYGEKVNGAPSISFESLDSGFEKDTWRVYYMGKRFNEKSAPILYNYPPWILTSMVRAPVIDVTSVTLKIVFI